MSFVQDKVVSWFGDIVERSFESPSVCRELVKAGLTAGYWYVRAFGDRRYPESLRYLNRISFEFMLDPLYHSQDSCWVNLFAPPEIIHAFGLKPLFVEAFSSFLSGMRVERRAIDQAEALGLAPTICSYHKAFIGAARVLPRPKAAIVSSTACDANLNTFRLLCVEKSVPLFTLDVPYECSRGGLEYMEMQLKDLVGFLEDVTSTRFDRSRLVDVVERRRRSEKMVREFLRLLADKHFPNTLTFEMYRMFTSHVFMGRPETEKFCRLALEDIRRSEAWRERPGCKRILWVHILPFYQPTLIRYFNDNPGYQILCNDFSFDYPAEDEYPPDVLAWAGDDPIRAVAARMVLNIYNGPFERKLSRILKYVELLRPDAVIHFNHWGCRQSAGGSSLISGAMRERGIPCLVLDGDGIDKRNCPDGQIRTRLEAFLETLGRG